MGEQHKFESKKGNYGLCGAPGCNQPKWATVHAEPAAPEAEPRKDAMKDGQIKYMVDRFLGWRLPEDFNPDGGISFVQNYTAAGYPMKHEPTGTNLFDATQAEEMIRYMVDGIPSEPAEPPAVPPAQDCPDCEAASRHAHSDATTPGFFSDRCESHRQRSSQPAGAEANQVGWCPSCDKLHPCERPECPGCGDYLIFAAEESEADAEDQLAALRESQRECVEALNELAGDPRFYRSEEGLWWCVICDSEAEIGNEIEHTPDCKIGKARTALANAAKLGDN